MKQNAHDEERKNRHKFKFNPRSNWKAESLIMH